MILLPIFTASATYLFFGINKPYLSDLNSKKTPASTWLSEVHNLPFFHVIRQPSRYDLFAITSFTFFFSLTAFQLFSTCSGRSGKPIKT